MPKTYPIKHFCIDVEAANENSIEARGRTQNYVKRENY